jgi:general secretion pathway protein C
MAASPVAVSPADPGVFQRFDAFFRAGGQGRSAEGSAGGGGQMRLYGLRSDGAGGGSAIIGLADGRQVSVGVGEEVEPGLVLRAVGPDHVTLARGASVSRLAFPDTPMEAVPVPSPNPAPQASLLTRPSPPTPDPKEAERALAGSSSGASLRYFLFYIPLFSSLHALLLFHTINNFSIRHK